MPKPAKQVKLHILAGPYSGDYNTYVDDISADGLVLVHPLIGQSPVPLHLGQQVKCEYYMEGQARISFTTRVNGRRPGVVPTVSLEIPADVGREQERSFVRLPAMLPAVFIVESRPDSEEVDSAPMKSRTADISGNGIQIFSQIDLPRGTRLRVLFELTNPKHRVDLIARVVRTIFPEDSTLDGVWLGLQFEVISNRDREAVIRFIFNEQRERRKKGLL